MTSATFIIDDANLLWIADRRSEHVACAAGGSVLAAGELVISESGKSIEVIEATNQSPGYCPEPDFWAAAFQFRRCDDCGSTNLIKDEIFECSVCGGELSREWNYERGQ